MIWAKLCLVLGALQMFIELGARTQDVCRLLVYLIKVYFADFGG